MLGCSCQDCTRIRAHIDHITLRNRALLQPPPPSAKIVALPVIQVAPVRLPVAA
jgi:hypothetical protein